MAGDLLWLVLVLAFGTVLHPELKAFYRHHSGALPKALCELGVSFFTDDLSYCMLFII